METIKIPGLSRTNRSFHITLHLIIFPASVFPSRRKFLADRKHNCYCCVLSVHYRSWHIIYTQKCLMKAWISHGNCFLNPHSKLRGYLLELSKSISFINKWTGLSFSFTLFPVTFFSFPLVEWFAFFPCPPGYSNFPFIKTKDCSLEICTFV